MTRTAVWFQHNLRIAGNSALEWALHRAQQYNSEIILFYLYSSIDEAPWQRGAASSWWLQQSLTSLKHDLSQRGLVLNLVRGSASDTIPRLIEQYNIDAISWQRNYEPHLAHRDQQLAEQLVQYGITLNMTNDGLLPDPGQLMTQKGTPYRVFTPFYRQLRKGLLYKTDQAESTTKPHAVVSVTLYESLTLEALNLLTPHPWQHKLARHHQPGEQSAHQQLQRFINERLIDYPTRRDIPAAEATSTLSASLHFGEISAQQILHILQPIIEHGNPPQASATEVFLRQLIWREFARYILWHFPNSAEESMDNRFDTSFWNFDEQRMQCWQRGETGVSIIDAGMQQLWQTGIMHNRVRMLAASYLTKNLAQPWQHGASWFWNTLVDADLANNSMGWQWVAGSGVDAAPYFRIFNPEIQAKKFDADGHYQHKWLNDFSRPATTLVEIADSRREAMQRYQDHIKRNHYK